MRLALNKDRLRVLSLGILCFQGFGIRIFDGVFNGAVVLWAVVLFFLNLKYIVKVPYVFWLKTLGIIFFYVGFCFAKNSTPLMWLCVALISAAICITPYYNNSSYSFTDDMRRLCKFCMYYDLAHIPIMLLAGSFLVTTSFGMNPKTFLYLFYFNSDQGLWGLNRIQGFCWEPSCWNLLLNLNLVFVLCFKESKKQVALSILSIVAIMSTTGLMTMSLIIVVYYVLMMNRKRVLTAVPVCLLFVFFILPIVLDNYSDKVKTGSGMARLGDFAIASAVLAENPWMGADLDNITRNRSAMDARHKVWTTSGDYKGFMSQGMVNSFAAMFVEWGIPMGLFIIFLTLRTPLLSERKVRFMYIMAFFLVLMGTPIMRTGFFYMLPMSSCLLNRKRLKGNGLIEMPYISNVSENTVPIIKE